MTSESHADTDRTVKPRRYAAYGAPLYLWVDRQDRTGTLYSPPSRLGCTHAEGPDPFGRAIRLSHPFDLERDPSGC
ncbi:hypothetical protein M2266_002675 [Streptomyces sp. SPB162]|nr:hypothetical protein [Streptomyces sp. SPB162]